MYTAEGAETAEPPAALRRAWYCEKWGALPRSGGVNDQSYREMHLMSTLSNVYFTITHYRSLTGNRIHTLTDGQRRVLRYLRDMDIWNG